MTRPCGKIAHLTRRNAQAQRRSVKDKHGTLNVYKCARCGLWHIGRGRPRITRFKAQEEGR